MQPWPEISVRYLTVVNTIFHRSTSEDSNVVMAVVLLICVCVHVFTNTCVCVQEDNDSLDDGPQTV